MCGDDAKKYSRTCNLGLIIWTHKKKNYYKKWWVS
ncbi:hypothetical protein [Chroococcidiopsis thermalis]